MRHRQWILRSWVASALVVASALMVVPRVRAADIFYENLLRDGVLAAERGEAERAARLLRLACFGLLEEPPVLARCLTHLAMVQASLDDADAFVETFQRLLGIEQRFQAYSRSDLSAQERSRFESVLQEMVSAETLARSLIFTHLAPEPEAGGPIAEAPEPLNPNGDDPPTSPPPAASPPPAVEPAAGPALPASSPPPGVAEAIARARDTRGTASREAAASELARLRPLADAHPEIAELQVLTAELAYRLRRWEESRAYFERAGEVGADRPELAFYYAVTLYETGAPARAAEVLGPSLPRLSRNAFVDGYVDKILGPGASR